MIISIDAEKPFDKSVIKTLSKLEIAENFLKLIRSIYEKHPTANILHGERQLNAFLIRSGTGEGYPFLPLLFNIVPEILTRAIRQEQEIKGIQIGKKEVGLFLFGNDINLYIENPKESARRTSMNNK